MASPAPLGPPRGQLARVSCATTTRCFAVGGGPVYATAATAELWNGLGWALVSVPTPAGRIAALNGVSCPSPALCMVVGSSQSGFARTPLIERWNGSSLSVLAAPNPAGATDASLRAVACPTTSSCFAVGSYSTGAGTFMLVERWNGSVWSIMSSPNPSPSSLSPFLAAVACPTATTCFAVGHAGNATFILRWNGTKWSIATSPNATTFGNDLSDVSCATATSCFAVGDFATESAIRPLIERWNGTAWSIVPTARPATDDSLLYGVACPSAAARCFAVGQAFGGAVAQPWVDVWDGSAWSTATAKTPTGVTSALLDVDCPAASMCTAVGHQIVDARLLTLIERWNGTSWLYGGPPDGSSQSRLLGVTCQSPANCVAVGGAFTAQSTPAALTQRWLGSDWSATPMPPSSAPQQLAAVTCPTSTSCFAVGTSKTTGGFDRMLIEHWNGSAWSVMANPTVTGNPVSTLHGVACVSSTHCFAVGSIGGKSLIIRWNGTKWSQMTSPTPTKPDTPAVLNAVTCPTGSSCFAVGSHGDDCCGVVRTLVVRWAGNDWTRMDSPDRANEFVSALAGVSCPNASMCFAVGHSESGTLVERWVSGSAWKIFDSPNVAGRLSVLSAMSCATATSCVAVGRSGPDASAHTLVEAWDGAHFVITPSPNPVGALSARLDAVTCRSGGPCFAVGSSRSARGQFTLIEQFA